jgi:hypothetical protein
MVYQQHNQPLLGAAERSKAKIFIDPSEGAHGEK